MTAPVSTLVAIGELIRNRPALGSPPLVVADWYTRKAVVLHHIAEQTGDEEAERCSQLAHNHARTLLATGGGVG